MLRFLSLNLKLITAFVFAMGLIVTSVTTGQAGNKRHGLSVSGGKKFHSGYKNQYRFKRNVKRSFGKSHRRHGQKIYKSKQYHASHKRSGVHLGAVSGGKYYKSYRYNHQRNVYAKRSGAKIVGVPNSQTNNSIYAYAYDGSSIEQDLLDDGSDYSIAIIRGPSVTPACPQGFNCGYRLYEDGTGPRIITPGMTAKGLPPQDGITGARIIRVK